MQYELFPKQDAFVFDNHEFSGYGGGFGNGKTLAGALKTWNHIQQKDAFFLIGRRHASDLTYSTQRDFLALFGQFGKFSPKRNTFRYYRDGIPWSEVLFMHLDDLQSLTNMNLSGFWIDQAEEVSEDAFDFLVGRIRRPTRQREGFITFNMNGHDWIWRRFLKKIGSDGKPLTNANDYFLVTASTLENRENLPEDYLKRLLAQPQEYVKRYVYGSWDVFAGQIYDEFNPFYHVLPQPFPIPQGWERFRMIDHGQKNPTCCLWGAVDFDGNIYVYQEYYQELSVVSMHVKAINDMSKVRTMGGDIINDMYSYTVIDPSTHAKTREKDGYRFSVADEYLDAGIATIAGQNDVLAGINRVKEYLKIDQNHYHPFRKIDGEPITGSPRLFIFPNCTNLIEEIEEYKWKQYTGKALGSVDRDEVKEAPVKRKDHAVDALRYGIMQRPQTPSQIQAIEPWVYQNSLELSRRAKLMGMTKDDLIAQRFHRTTIKHSSNGIQHTDGLKDPVRR